MLVLLRSFVFSLGYAVSIVLFGLLAVFLLPFPAITRHRIMLSWCSFTIFWVKLTCGIRYQILGLENVEKIKSPYVILAKHQSPWETFMLQILFFPATTILKEELLKIPFFGWGLRCFRPIAIDRSKPKDAMKQVKKGGVASLAAGLNVLLFPEGTRIKPGERGRYARGGAEIAIAGQVEILPIAQNAGYYWPGKSFRKYPGLVTVVIGEPISVEGKTSRDAMQEVEDWIEGKMVELNKSDNKLGDSDGSVKG